MFVGRAVVKSILTVETPRFDKRDGPIYAKNNLQLILSCLEANAVFRLQNITATTLSDATPDLVVGLYSQMLRVRMFCQISLPCRPKVRERSALSVISFALPPNYNRNFPLHKDIVIIFIFNGGRAQRRSAACGSEPGESDVQRRSSQVVFSPPTRLCGWLSSSSRFR